MANLTPTAIILIGLAVVVGLVLLFLIIFLPQMTSRNKSKRRAKRILSGGEAGEITKESAGKRVEGRRRQLQARLREADEKSGKEKPSRALRYRQELRRAGLKVSLQRYFMTCGALFVIAGVGYLFLPFPLIGLVPVALTIGFGLPLFVVKRMGSRRTKKFTLYFADAVDVIIRGIRSGLPIGECLNIIARESPEPVGPIFVNVVEATKIGLTLDQSLKRAEEDMPTPEFRYFSIVLNIQQQTGGNLADTLANLSGILRERKKLRDKIQALSSEAKASAMIIGSLPPLVCSALWILNPQYMNVLFVTTPGQAMIIGSILWMSMGVFVMRQMINFDF